MVRQKNREFHIGVTNQRLGLSAGDTWEQKMLHEKYLKALDQSKYKEINATKKKRSKKQEKKASPTKRTPSPECYDFRCKARPNTASSNKKPPLFFDSRYTERGRELDETDKFFEIVRDTVTGVVEKKLADMVGSHFHNVLQRVEEIAQKLRKTENNFNVLCGELNNKLNHYGEEHSRHFRYICMKLEYDKIFYQHMNGFLRSDNVNSGRYSCGQSLAQDLINLNPSSQSQQCPCTCRVAATTRNSPKCEPTSNSLDNQGSRSPKKLPVGDNACQSHRIHGSGDGIGMDKLNSQDNLKPGESNIGNSDLGLKEILATIKQYYPNQENQKGAEKRNNRRRRELEVDACDDESTEVSSRANSDDLTSTTPDIMNIKKIQNFIR